MASQGELRGRLFFFPQEIFELIFENLDIESVLSLRLVRTHPAFARATFSRSQCLLNKACRMFYTTTASVWLYFANKFQSMPQSPRSDEPLGDYTSEELRDWVLRRYRAEQAWNGPSSARLQVHRVYQDKSFTRHSAVLPGGRWFLSTNGLCKITLVDMDSPQSKPTSLIKISRYLKGTRSRGEYLKKFIIWVDPDALRLTFRIVLAVPEFEGMRFSTPLPACFHLTLHIYLPKT